jgi:hypothetical protein
MSDSMGKAVYEAAKAGKEAELTRLIGLGGNVNWRHEVRRRMCLVWAPASSPPLLVALAADTALARDGAIFPTKRGGAGYAAAPPPRRAWHTRPRRMARAAPPRACPRSSRALALDDSACASFAQDGYTALMLASWFGHEGCVRLLLEAEAIEVNATVNLEHALPQHMRWVRLHVVIPLGLSFVFRTSTTM